MSFNKDLQLYSKNAEWLIMLFTFNKLYFICLAVSSYLSGDFRVDFVGIFLLPLLLLAGFILSKTISTSSLIRCDPRRQRFLSYCGFGWQTWLTVRLRRQCLDITLNSLEIRKLLNFLKRLLPKTLAQYEHPETIWWKSCWYIPYIDSNDTIPILFHQKCIVSLRVTSWQIAFYDHQVLTFPTNTARTLEKLLSALRTTKVLDCTWYCSCWTF